MICCFPINIFPDKIPTGNPITLPIAIRIPVPTSAFAIPPPASPAGFGICVKNAQLIELTPCETV